MLRPTLPRLTLTLASLVLTLGVTPPLPAQEQSAQEESTPEEKAEELPPGPPIEGFQQLLPRGGIPALVDPEFVAAAEAEIPDDAWVLGFEHAGEAYAYSLNLLNHHEVVNHTIGSLPVAAVW